MGRAPCCEKMGLKRGPWTAEEDQELISYIQQHGHANWRALPKQAGLLRCGKSCRLRWMNYLRPDIKRGNFTAAEEDTIIKLHEMLGNRWSAIAARLPGRTDNEIKNVWHTHLKKRLKNYQTTSKSKDQFVTAPKFDSNVSNISPEDSSSELSSVTDQTSFPNNVVTKDEQMVSSENFAEIDESFWSEELSVDNSNVQSDFLGFNHESQFQLPLSPTMTSAFTTDIEKHAMELGSNTDDGMDFWYNLLIRAGGLPELPEF